MPWIDGFLFNGDVAAPVWRTLVAADTPTSVRELHQRTSAHPSSIETRLARWVRAGLVTSHPGRPVRYAMHPNTPRTPLPPLVGPSGAIRPRGTTRDRLWRAMRVLRTFDLPALMIAAEATRRSAEDLVNCLQRAGYLRQLARGNGMRGTWSRYQLIRNTGPRAPTVSHRLIAGVRCREVVDGNTAERVDISPAAVSLRRKCADPVADGGVG